MSRLLTLLLLLTLGASALAQTGFSTLEEQMSGKEFTETGLDKLSDEELTALNEWLRQRTVGSLSSASQPTEDLRGFEAKTVADINTGDIVSRVKGPFTGWEGETIFELENGMIWKQREKDRFFIAEVENPVVRIEKGMTGVWRLQVDGYNKSVKVERLQ